jgi:hypothetical protein
VSLQPNVTLVVRSAVAAGADTEPPVPPPEQLVLISGTLRAPTGSFDASDIPRIVGWRICEPGEGKSLLDKHFSHVKSAYDGGLNDDRGDAMIAIGIGR